MSTIAQQPTRTGEIIQPIPANTTQFLQTNHVVSIAIYAGGTIWSVCCFYVFNEPATRLIVLTSQKARHGRMVAVNPYIVGTVAGQPGSIAKISSIRLTTHACLLEDGTAKKPALSLYCEAHPTARAMRSDVWVLNLDTVKFTDNELVFAQKIHQQQEED